jgi:hypothetical protein
MRTVGKLTLGLTVAILFVSLVGGQQPFPIGGFIPGGGGADPLALLRNESVKKELGLTEEQTAKIPDAVHKALAGVLDAKQLKRLREIELQQRGPSALADAKVQEELKLSESQAKSIKTIVEDSRKQREDIRKEFKDDRKGAFEKFQTLQKETNEKLQEVLSAEQRRAWKQMLGDKCKLEFRFGGGEFKKGRKKTDDLQ